LRTNRLRALSRCSKVTSRGRFSQPARVARRRACPPKPGRGVGPILRDCRSALVPSSTIDAADHDRGNTPLQQRRPARPLRCEGDRGQCAAHPQRARGGSRRSSPIELASSSQLLLALPDCEWVVNPATLLRVYALYPRSLERSPRQFGVAANGGNCPMASVCRSFQQLHSLAAFR
jgi:hypothetical protein